MDESMKAEAKIMREQQEKLKIALSQKDAKEIRDIFNFYRGAILKRAKKAKETYNLTDDAYGEMEAVMLQCDLMIRMIFDAWDIRNNTESE